ncbi:MAG TPA: DUF1236 domain-containing protein [Xanthobacteraceae bacterium]|nr:DUF1236 domain-containing protein [Xanthobacteraceae bacterium]
MKKMLIIGMLAAGSIAISSSAFAQAQVPGAIGGAAAGAVVGGPVGAVVGGVAGAVIGAAASPPPEVRTYVMQEQVPSVRVEREVIVGYELPGTVVLHPVPQYDAYSYAVVNDRRVIVEPRTRKVIQIVE